MYITFFVFNILRRMGGKKYSLSSPHFPRVSIYVVCRFNSTAIAMQRELTYRSVPTLAERELSLSAVPVTNPAAQASFFICQNRCLF